MFVLGGRFHFVFRPPLFDVTIGISIFYNMEKNYFIVGDWDELRKNIIPADSQAKLIESEEMAGYSSKDFDYMVKTFPESGRQFVVETNRQTGERLFMIPFEQKFGTGIKAIRWADQLLDLLLEISKDRGYWPVRSINFHD